MPVYLLKFQTRSSERPDEYDENARKEISSRIPPFYLIEQSLWENMETVEMSDYVEKPSSLVL